MVGRAIGDRYRRWRRGFLTSAKTTLPVHEIVDFEPPGTAGPPKSNGYADSEPCAHGRGQPKIRVIRVIRVILGLPGWPKVPTQPKIPKVRRSKPEGPEVSLKSTKTKDCLEAPKVQ